MRLMIEGQTLVDRPLSIRLFAILFGLGLMLSVVLAFLAAESPQFGFATTSDAARTLAFRILTIRLLGTFFALSMMLAVTIWKSRAARSALVLRWGLGVLASPAFLRGIGIILPDSSGGQWVIILSLAQLVSEAFAILVLYGDDANDWFRPRSWY